MRLQSSQVMPSSQVYANIHDEKKIEIFTQIILKWDRTQ